MTDVTNVMLAGLAPPNIVRRMTARDDFESIIYAPSTKFQYQDCSPPWPHDGDEEQSFYQRRASHRRLHAMDWDDIISTTPSYPSHGVGGNDVRKPTPTRQFEQSRVSTFCNQRTSRSSDFHSSHSTPHTNTQKYPSVSSKFKQLQSRDHHCSQNSQDVTQQPSFIVPSNISELIADLNAKAKILSREEEDEYDESSSLEYSSDDSMIEAAIYKSVAPPLLFKQQQKEQSMGGSTMKDLICAVCLDFPDDPKHIASVSGCNHRFCYSCIENWAKRGNNKCPLCKSTFHLVASGNRVSWY
eukprot:CAMPEP_0201720354 /NCGR_PEP_ID=MMETSP0593-20130828/5345_1 /ASSEMBLY_ACC=CAM_ASM_000672 /TAXON_ID=267983 /ORGANISM="Skeletonema japonicum, Strain CCMP2506" /LENGTH=298 /DNA_ID=CAMNT_0048210993 /DNA_START=125 /DNA_END=1021 /DNA_ORIENTATION=-